MPEPKTPQKFPHYSLVSNCVKARLMDLLLSKPKERWWLAKLARKLQVSYSTMQEALDFLEKNKLIKSERIGMMRFIELKR